VPDFRQEDADELHRVTDTVFGTWNRRKDGHDERSPGILERLERIELMVKVGIAAAGVVGACLGSVITLAIQHWFHL
jgi:hypothetical protein